MQCVGCGKLWVMAGGGPAGQQAGVDSFDICGQASKAAYASRSGRVLICRREGV